MRNEFLFLSGAPKDLAKSKSVEPDMVGPD